MEASELMMGDWVLARITNTDKRQVIKLGSVDAVDTGFLECEPIEITAGLLELNGYKKKKPLPNSSYWQWEKTFDSYGFVEILMAKRTTIRVYECVENEFLLTNRVNVRAKYVHELQHALRVAGLGRYANELKIEEYDGEN